jgi:CheY-like chemotaxis protein
VARTILVVEDEYGSLEVLTFLLEREGYQVIPAGDGEEALERLHERKPDLVITDFWMPKLDGAALCQKMQEDERWQGIPVILMSAVHGADMPRPAGVVAFARKPLVFSVLIDIVRQTLARL